MNIQKTGSGKVILLAGGGKVYTDIAARFVRSERDIEEIANSPYSAQIVKNILSAGHKAALEFDYFIFGVEGFSRVTETQLVRKRMASYLIKSGRAELGGARSYSLVMPEEISSYPGVAEWLKQGRALYERMVADGIPEENARYIKPQATEFKAIIGMNAHALHDWFSIRCCMNAQNEIRDLAWKMLKLCRGAAPDLFEGAGPNCVQLGYCPENERQHKSCAHGVLTKNKALRVLKEYKGGADD